MTLAISPGSGPADTINAQPSIDGTFGDGELFKEIGRTLETISGEVVQGGVTALKTAIARRALESPEGQQQIVSVRNQQIGKFLPFIIIGVVLLILFGRKLA